MTVQAATVGDVFAAAEGGAAAVEAAVDGTVSARGTRAPGRARIAATEGDRNGVILLVWGWLRRAAVVVRADLAGAWPWRGSAPTLRDLWAVRHPTLDQVPGRSKTIRALWMVYNYAALAATAVMATALWLMQHPARFLLAAVLLGPPIIAAVT